MAPSLDYCTESQQQKESKLKATKISRFRVLFTGCSCQQQAAPAPAKMLSGAPLKSALRAAPAPHLPGREPTGRKVTFAEGVLISPCPVKDESSLDADSSPKHSYFTRFITEKQWRTAVLALEDTEVYAPSIRTMYRRIRPVPVQWTDATINMHVDTALKRLANRKRDRREAEDPEVRAARKERKHAKRARRAQRTQSAVATVTPNPETPKSECGAGGSGVPTLNPTADPWGRNWGGVPSPSQYPITFPNIPLAPSWDSVMAC